MPATQSADADNALIRLLLTPEGRADPYALYRQIRDEAPVLRSSLGPVVLSRYEDCALTLRDPHLGRGTKLRLDGGSAPAGGFGMGGFGGMDADPAARAEFFETAGNNMLFADPPDHTRLRRLANRAFTPARVEALRPAVADMVDDLLDVMEDEGDVDVMPAMAYPLPVTVIGELVGVPASDRDAFQPLVRAGTVALEPTADAGALAEASKATAQLRDYFLELLAARRRDPKDDLLSALAESREQGDALSDDEVVATAILLYAAGFETTTNLIGNGLLALLRHPEQLDRWRRDPSLSRTGVDELLRWDSPVQVNMRMALEPAVVAGESLDVGDSVLVLQGGANRDPERFTDAETLDVGRRDNQPLSFGGGIHHCLGAGLARMEGEVVFSRMLQRFGSIELLDDVPEWRTTLTLRGLSSLAVRVTLSA
jgi:cytochrome P450